MKGDRVDSAHPAFLQLIPQVPPEPSPQEGGQSYQGGRGRERVPVHLSDDVIIQGQDVTQLRLQQAFTVGSHDIELNNPTQ